MRRPATANADPSAATGAAVVRLENVSVPRGRRPVLHGIDWQVFPGSRWLVTGGNGAGKSTLLELLAGLQWPAPGAGRRWYDFGEGSLPDAVRARREVVLVSPAVQDDYLRRGWSMTIRELVATGFARSEILRRPPTRRQWAQVNRLLGRLELAAIADEDFLSLSRGQQRWALVARALLAPPPLLLLDEAFESLDEHRRRQLLAELSSPALRTSAVVLAAPRAPAELLVDFRRLQLEGGRRTDCRVAARAAAAVPPPRRAVNADDDWLIRLQGASVRLDGREILAGLEWTLRPGEHWWIRGANGAGKSTFLRLLHAQLRPARGGTIHWRGTPALVNVWHLRRRIAWFSPTLTHRYRYRDSALDAVLSGVHSTLGLLHRTDAAARLRAQALLEAFGLGAERGRNVRELSHGQTVRVLLARSLVNRPEVLLLDEPLSGLDDTSAAALEAGLRRAAAEGTTLVLASHEAPPAAELFAWRLTFRGGRARASRATPPPADDRGLRDDPVPPGTNQLPSRK